MRRTRTWTISLPPELSRLAQQLADAEHRTKSELIREALRCYLDQRGRPLATGAAERLAQVGELADFYRRRHAPHQPSEAQLRRQFRGVRRLHEQLRHLAE